MPMDQKKKKNWERECNPYPTKFQAINFYEDEWAFDPCLIDAERLKWAINDLPVICPEPEDFQMEPEPDFSDLEFDMDTQYPSTDWIEDEMEED